MADETNEKFNLAIVRTSFLAAVHEKDDVKLKDYLESYNELNKFFTPMGKVFGFVSSDLKAKVEILENFLSDAKTADNFETIKKMMEYEMENQLLHKKGYVSGSRTLLRLHRGLDFIRDFLKKLSELRDEDGAGHACRDSYDQTLAQFHPFMIRGSARVAMKFLPTRGELLERVMGDPDQIKEALEILPPTLEATCNVYDRTESLYTANDLHSLP